MKYQLFNKLLFDVSVSIEKNALPKIINKDIKVNFTTLN